MTLRSRYRIVTLLVEIIFGILLKLVMFLLLQVVKEIAQLLILVGPVLFLEE